MKTTQLLIIGGGCAGLSLGHRLAHAGSPTKAIIIEPRSGYEDDRTWCFWSEQGSQQEHLPLANWNQIHLSSESRSVNIHLGSQSYQMLRSIDFYRAAVAAIQGGNGVELFLETTALSSHKDDSGKWHTETSLGPIVSDFVIDTRPNKSLVSRPPLLWQSFVGQEVECDAEIFDAEVAHLMDFQTATPSCVPFVYVLPTSSHRALIEMTVLSSMRPHPDDLAQRLDLIVKKTCGDHPFRVLRREQGAIPMGLPPSTGPSDPTYVSVGVGSGTARPSSGYTFCRIQTWADACAKALLAGGPPVGPIADSRLVQFMDHVFLKVLRLHPSLAPELFLRMFEKVPAPRLLRFLSDSPTLLDAMHLIGALPKIPFLQAWLGPEPKRGLPAIEE